MSYATDFVEATNYVDAKFKENTDPKRIILVVSKKWPFGASFVKKRIKLLEEIQHEDDENIRKMREKREVLDNDARHESQFEDILSARPADRENSQQPERPFS